MGRRAGVSHNAPYKHFSDKQALLAAVATRELNHTASIIRRAGGDGGLASAVEEVIARAVRRPRRFQLVYGPWATDSAELAVAAETAWQLLVGAVEVAQGRRELPAGDPGKLANLIRATVHGAIDLTLSGHLSKGRDGGTTAVEIVRAQLALLRAAG
ncbi:TetR/AcrR family transcriptional regulator [Phytohabitans suffuscus]|uniref:TetR family transcriptional regulator n=1 Tax=Phytohabitans suffuscus TaxID=624315 RepID=A0A6F8YAL5_9ACTN|nr:TetR-like C-terminal domain-containing protein [Phytohabitans suffuscus]BCB83146.1 TetR family transcriptional regulator [Phytohabitans suffuscus]